VQLAGRRVLITGGARGIGRAMGRWFAIAGAEVVIWDLDAAAAERTAAWLTAGSGRPHHAAGCDVTDRAAVHARARELEADLGPVDVVVNNAGVVSGKELTELTEADVRRTFEVNTLALYWVTQAFLPGMIERGTGHVVTIASAAGWIGVRKQTDYSASKHAAVGFDESLRMELRRRAPGVRTTVVCPFYIDTGMFTGVRTRVPWLLPILDEQQVARKVVLAVQRDRPQLFLPPIVGTLPTLRVLGVRVFDTAAELLGVNVSMEDFVGHADLPADRRSAEVAAGG
jgi:all-trans-retinol dehydrogenase (NAD+)